MGGTAALNSAPRVFLYGPRTGKDHIRRDIIGGVLAEDDVWIPYAIEVDGQIITVYDPVVHKRFTGGATRERDERWVLCRRPTVLVGGELTINMLDCSSIRTRSSMSAPCR